MSKFEYRVPLIEEVEELMFHSKTEAEMEAKLDKLGAHGWQVVHYDRRFSALILMRERSNDE